MNSTPLIFRCAVAALVGLMLVGHLGAQEAIPDPAVIGEFIAESVLPESSDSELMPRGHLFSAKRKFYNRLGEVNRKIQGRIVDHTRNHGSDQRFYSPSLCQMRDMYVYLPPCYDPSNAYPLVLWFHGAFGDETSFLLGRHLLRLDHMIRRGECPPMIVACPDCTYEGVRKLTVQHSFLVNGLGGRYEDYIVDDVLPFLSANYSVRPEREAHALAGVSAGGFGALSLALRHRDQFTTVAVLAGPVNMRYWNTKERYFANFKPETFVWKTEYNPRQVVGRFFVVVRLRADRMIGQVFGPDDQILENIERYNPADLLHSTQLKPGDLNIYINYPSHDNFNFDAHAESFVWIAEQQGIPVDVERANLAKHLMHYFRSNEDEVYKWIGSKILGPVPVGKLEPASSTHLPPPAAGTHQ